MSLSALATVLETPTGNITIETNWNSAGARTVFELLQRELEKAVAPPAWVSTLPMEAQQEWWMRVAYSIEPIRNEMLRLYMLHTHMVMNIGPQETAAEG